MDRIAKAKILLKIVKIFQLIERLNHRAFEDIKTEKNSKNLQEICENGTWSDLDPKF